MNDNTIKRRDIGPLTVSLLIFSEQTDDTKIQWLCVLGMGYVSLLWKKYICSQVGY